MYEMNFIIRKAVSSDVEGIMRIMGEAKASPKHSAWFVADDEEFVREHLEGWGFVMVAEAPDGEIAGFFLVKKPTEEENLGVYLDFEKNQLDRTMIMDSAAVGIKYRGNHLQSRLLQAAEQEIDRTKYAYLLCTVHPGNIYSLHNMERNGYEVRKTVRCYGGLTRHILMKELPVD